MVHLETKVFKHNFVAQQRMKNHDLWDIYVDYLYIVILQYNIVYIYNLMFEIGLMLSHWRALDPRPDRWWLNVSEINCDPTNAQKCKSTKSRKRYLNVKSVKQKIQHSNHFVWRPKCLILLVFWGWGKHSNGWNPNMLLWWLFTDWLQTH